MVAGVWPIFMVAHQDATIRALRTDKTGHAIGPGCRNPSAMVSPVCDTIRHVKPSGRSSRPRLSAIKFVGWDRPDTTDGNRGIEKAGGLAMLKKGSSGKAHDAVLFCGPR